MGARPPVIAFHGDIRGLRRAASERVHACRSRPSLGVREFVAPILRPIQLCDLRLPHRGIDLLAAGRENRLAITRRSSNDTAIYSLWHSRPRNRHKRRATQLAFPGRTFPSPQRKIPDAIPGSSVGCQLAAFALCASAITRQHPRRSNCVAHRSSHNSSADFIR